MFHATVLGILPNEQEVLHHDNKATIHRFLIQTTSGQTVVKVHESCKVTINGAEATPTDIHQGDSVSLDGQPALTCDVQRTSKVRPELFIGRKHITTKK